MSDAIVYLNNEYLPLENAKIPVLDRGFIFGDGVYEVIPVFHGTPFRLEHHLARLKNSINAVKIDNPHTESEWASIISEVISRNNPSDQSIYLQVTRGIAKRDHKFPADTHPTVFVMSNPFKPVAEDELQNGVTAITLDDIRWQYCHIKSIALLPNILLRQQAIDNNATEAILVKDGNITEGAASNIFIVKEGVIYTPPKSDCLLPGITRDLVVELAQSHNIPCQEKTFSLEALEQADEIWLTSSTKEILPITRLNKKLVGSGKPGSVWQTMYNFYQDYKSKLAG
jgi:D-alanine transaminase